MVVKNKKRVGWNKYFSDKKAVGQVGGQEVGSESTTTKKKKRKQQEPIGFTVVAKTDSDGNLSHELAIAEYYGDAESHSSRNGTTLPDINYSLSQIFRRSNPNGLQGKLETAYAWVDDDDLLASLIKVKLDFTLAGLSLQCKLPSIDITTLDSIDDLLEQNQELTAFSELIKKIGLKHDLQKVISDLLRDWFISDNMILYWHVTPAGSPLSSPDETPTLDSVPVTHTLEDGYIPEIDNICALPPSDVEWYNFLGADVLMIRIPEELKRKIQNAISEAAANRESKTEAIQKLISSGIGLKWIEAAIDKDKQGLVELRNSDGDYWLIRTKQRKYHGLSSPSMKTIFVPLEIRKSLSEGELSAAFMMKHFIMLIQQGESIDNGPMVGSTQNWLKPKDAEKLLDLFKNVSRTMRLAADHTLKISFIFPPKEIFSPDKYASCNNRILNWVGVIGALLSGEGGKYSGGFIGIKRLIADINNSRNEVSKLFYTFFDHSTVAERINKPAGSDVVVAFDENILKEPRQILDEVKLILASGIGDPPTSLRELGRDPDAIKSSKLRSILENQIIKIWEKISSSKKEEENLDTKPSGGQAGDNTTLNDLTRQQPPVARVTENT